MVPYASQLSSSLGHREAVHDVDILGIALARPAREGERPENRLEAAHPAVGPPHAERGGDVARRPHGEVGSLLMPEVVSCRHDGTDEHLGVTHPALGSLRSDARPPADRRRRRKGTTLISTMASVCPRRILHAPHPLAGKPVNLTNSIDRNLG